MTTRLRVAPLTSQQQATIASLVAAGRLMTVTPDLAKAGRFLEHARQGLADTRVGTSPITTFDVAYNAAHDVGEALLSAYGYRAASGPGTHVAVGQFLEALFDAPPARLAAIGFDTVRTQRNGLRYKAEDPSSAQVTGALKVAQGLYDGAATRLIPMPSI